MQAAATHHFNEAHIYTKSFFLVFQSVIFTQTQAQFLPCIKAHWASAFRQDESLSDAMSTRPLCSLGMFFSTSSSSSLLQSLIQVFLRDFYTSSMQHFRRICHILMYVYMYVRLCVYRLPTSSDKHGNNWPVCRCRRQCLYDLLSTSAQIRSASSGCLSSAWCRSDHYAYSNLHHVFFIINICISKVLGEITRNKKFELMLTRRAKAYSSSCSIVQLKIGVFTLS